MTCCRAARIGLACAALFWAQFGSAMAETKAPSPTMSRLAAAKDSASCPSQEFSKFMEAFSENVLVQRRFTRFPLEFRYVDSTLIGTKEEDAALKKRMIESFEMIPFRFGEASKVSVFPNKLERRKKRLETKMGQREGTTLDEKSVVLFEPDTDNVTYYSFHRERACWYLHLIDSQSL